MCTSLRPYRLSTVASRFSRGPTIKARVIGTGLGIQGTLELNISEEDAAKKKTQALLQDLNRKIDEVRPFAQLPLFLAGYRGYDRVEVFVGKVAGEIEGFDSVTTDYEAFSAPGLHAVFVPKSQAAAMRDFLTQHGFTSIPVPEGDGDPREILSNLLA